MLASVDWPDDVEILREDDPRRGDLEDAGWRIVATSWGARLNLHDEDIPRLRWLVDRVAGGGYEVVELASHDAGAVHGLERLNQPDYPQAGPATAHPLMTRAETDSLFSRGRVFGARQEGQLVAVTATHLLADRVETDFTSVHLHHRGQGLAQGVKAAAVLAYAGEGWRTFATGGSEINDVSLAMNTGVGYQVTEVWRTYAPPA